MLALFIAVFSVGHFREVLARSLVVPSADVVLQPGFGNALSASLPFPSRQLTENVIGFVNNQEEFLDIRIQEFNVGRLDSANKQALYNKDEIEQSFVLVKTKTTRRRGKRYVQRAPLTPYCLFKICKMGRKRAHPS